MPWPKTEATHYHACTVRTQTKVMQSKWSDGCYLTKYHWVLESRIPLHVDDALDSLDDLLKSKENPALTR